MATSVADAADNTDIALTKAYPGDGKKRRSFLPAPKKSPTSSLPPQPSFPLGPTSSGSYTILQRAYVSKLPGAQSSSSSVSPSSSLSSISLPSSSISSTSIPIGDKHGSQLPNDPDENRCGVGLRVGARVKIGGIKPGILRYLGTTHLAPGIFCGIELLEADGKHDGEVNGHRYFYCPPNCGIFAPKEKVCIDSSVSSRLSSESDGNLYSSNESLTERTYKAFRSFEEGELEAVDCSVLSPESPHGETGKRKVETPPDWGSRSTDSIDSQDSSFFQSKSKSRLPRSGKGSNIPSPQGHSLRSPGTGPLSYVAFGYQRVHEDNHASQNQGKDGHETKGKDIQNLEKGRAASRIQELYKDKQTTEKDAQIVDENESKRQFLQGDSLRHVRSYQTRPDDKQYLNFASDPRDPEPQRSADRKNAEDRSIYKRHSHSQYSGDEGSPQNKDSRLDSTFEIIPSPLPSCHPANRTFDVVSASPSVTSIREGRNDLPLTSTPEPGCNTTRFEGRSPFITDPQSSGPSSLSSSGTDAEGREGRLSATFSLSDSQVQSSQTLLHDGDAPNTSIGDPQVNVIDPGSTRDNHNVGSVQLRAYYQQGYAPDTDSEIGTLTFNSPNTDWLDRCGVAHPTTFAPPEELGFNGDVPSATRELESSFQRTSTPVGNSALGKPSYLHGPGPGGSVDDASDLTSGPEQDDRAEADQVYGDPVTNRSASGSGVRSSVPRSRRDTAQTTSSADAPSSSQASFEDEEEEDDDEEDQEYDEDENIDDLVPCQDLEFSFKVNAPIDFFAATSSAAHSDEDEEGEATVKRNPKRKAMTITRKRSENISHKMPNTRKVTSRLADYIKTPPVPSRPRDEQQNDKVARNNAKNISPKKRLSAADIGNRPNTGNGTPNSRRGSTVDKGGAGDGDVAGGESSRRSQVTPQPPKPAIKRAPPKSKWGDIMSQIESGKGATKPKPKSEIKSSLAAYLNTPPPSLADKGNQQQEGDEPSTHSSTSNSNQTPPRKKFESRIKPLPPPPPKIDLSKVKSKLGVPTAASATKAQPKRDSQASNSNANSRRSLSRESSPANGARKGGKRMSEPHILQGKQNKQLLSAANTRTNSVADSSIISSARSSITDLSISAADHLDADGTPSKRGSTDVSRKLSTNSTKSEVSELKNGHARSNRRTIEIKSNAPPNNISKRPRANGTIGKSLSGTPNRGGTSSSASSSTCTSMAQQRAEIVRLESLCESRTKELTMAKIQYKDTTRAFDAMSVLFNYCSAELEAFKVQLADCMAQIGELNQDKSKLDSSLKQACLERDQQTERAGQAEALTEKGVQEHATLIKEMEGTHDAALTAQRDDLTKQHQEAARALHEQHNKHIERLKQYQERKMNDAKNESKMEISNLRIAHLEEIQELRNKHDAQMEELHKQHRNKLEDITHRFETIKLTLSEKVESLRGECEDLTKRAKTSEEALQRDADVKVQIAIAPFLNLPKEVESLKTVVEMRNEEIQRLRTKNMDLEKQLEEVPIGREKIISLQQKVENLEAIINIKTDHEKQLHEKCQVLMRKYDRESRANKTLSMENEQIMWRMSQSAEFGSSDSLTSLTTSITSLPGSLSGSAAGGSSKRHVSRTGAGSGDRLRQPRDAASPDMQGASPMSKSFHAGEEVQMRVKHNRASSGSGHRRSTGGSGRRGADWDNERQLRSRSATFVVEKGDGTDGGDGESSSGSAGSHSLSSSPQAKPGSRRRGRQLSQGNSDWLNGDYDATISSNLSQSAGAVLHYELPSHASPRRGDGVTSHSPLVISAACTSTPRLDETFEDVSETTTANTTREDIVMQGEGGNTDNAMMMTSMGSSCTRSISSGVSDSGVYDSMTRSELLNSSMVSTDSEWGASSTFSNNASMTLDAALDLDDHDARSGPKTRDYNSLNDVTLVNNTCGSRSDTGSKDLTATNNSSFTIALHESPLVCDNSKVSRHQPLYTQQVSVPDDVFDEDMSMESCSFAAAGDNGHGLQGIDSLTSSVEVEEEVDEEEEEGCGFSVTCSDTVTDLAGVCSTKSPH